MTDSGVRADGALQIPFDAGQLDELMETARIDVLLATSKHNVQYLLGGHRAIFFDYMDAAGVSRYLPVLVYPKGAPHATTYVGHRLESLQREITSFWMPEAHTTSFGSVDAIEKAVAHMRRLGQSPRRIGVETAFLPVDAWMALRDAFPEAEIVNAHFVLERLRSRKSPAELQKLRTASELVTDAMVAVIETHGPGTTKRELFEALRREETNRGLVFEYCLVTAGTSLSRAPSGQRWEDGDILSLDSGGNFQGYIGDLCRMAILGEPDAELVDLLGEIDEVQRAAMSVVRPGTPGGEIFVKADSLLSGSRHHNHTHFLAHGMGLVTHEAPRLTTQLAYDDYDATRPLEEGMVISIETTLQHPRRGFIKLEDTVAVTSTGFEIYGDRARGWNRGAVASR